MIFNEKTRREQIQVVTKQIAAKREVSRAAREQTGLFEQFRRVFVLLRCFLK